jgi:hypothetical protein
MIFSRWFYFHFVKILKTPRNFWNELELPEYNAYVIWFGFICLFVGLGFEEIIQFFLVDMTQQALIWDAHLVDRLAVVFKMPVEKYADFFSAQLVFSKKQSVLMILLLPVVPYFVIYLFAGALHFFMNIFGYIRSFEPSYERTLCIVCFSFAPAIFTVIPIVGIWIATVWILMLLVKGLSKNYQLTFFKSLTSVLVPALLIKMIWVFAMQFLVNAMPNFYFENPLLKTIPVQSLLSAPITR